MSKDRHLKPVGERAGKEVSTEEVVERARKLAEWGGEDDDVFTRFAENLEVLAESISNIDTRLQRIESWQWALNRTLGTDPAASAPEQTVEHLHR